MNDRLIEKHKNSIVIVSDHPIRIFLAPTKKDDSRLILTKGETNVIFEEVITNE